MTAQLSCEKVPKFAQYGDEGRCARCGYKVVFEERGDGGLWVAVRRTSKAPRPGECSARSTPGPHRTETHGATGAPLPPRTPPA